MMLTTSLRRIRQSSSSSTTISSFVLSCQRQQQQQQYSTTRTLLAKKLKPTGMAAAEGTKPPIPQANIAAATKPKTVSPSTTSSSSSAAKGSGKGFPFFKVLLLGGLSGVGYKTYKNYASGMDPVSAVMKVKDDIILFKDIGLAHFSGATGIDLTDYISDGSDDDEKEEEKDTIKESQKPATAIVEENVKVEEKKTKVEKKDEEKKEEEVKKEVVQQSVKNEEVEKVESVVVEEKKKPQAVVVTEKTAKPVESVAVATNTVNNTLATDALVNEAIADSVEVDTKAKSIRLDGLVRASEDLHIQSAAMKKELDATILSGIENLNADELKIRLIQMASEMQNRTKWEAVRLSQALKQQSEEVSKQYIALLSEQKETFETVLKKQQQEIEMQFNAEVSKMLENKDNEARAAIREAVSQAEVQLNEQLKNQLDIKTKEYNANMTKQKDVAIIEYNANLQAQLDTRIQAYQDMVAKIKALDNVFSTETDYEMLSYKVHKITAGISMLQNKLSSGDSAKKEIEIFKKLCKDDELLTKIVNSLPKQASTIGVPTFTQLQTRFDTVMTAGIKASLVPENAQGSLFGNMIGSGLSLLKVTPKGLVDGDATDETLARTKYYLNNGDLVSAVAEAKTVKGLAANVIKDWVNDATYRLEVEQGLKVINARSSLWNICLV